MHQSCGSSAQVPGTGASCGDRVFGTVASEHEVGLHPAAGVLEEEETREADSCVTTEQRSGVAWTPWEPAEAGGASLSPRRDRHRGFGLPARSPRGAHFGCRRPLVGGTLSLCPCFGVPGTMWPRGPAATQPGVRSSRNEGRPKRGRMGTCPGQWPSRPGTGDTGTGVQGAAGGHSTDAGASACQEARPQSRARRPHRRCCALRSRPGPPPFTYVFGELNKCFPPLPANASSRVLHVLNIHACKRVGMRSLFII